MKNYKRYIIKRNIIIKKNTNFYAKNRKRIIGVSFWAPKQ